MIDKNSISRVIFFTFSSGFRILVRVKLLLSQRETNTGSQLLSVRSHRDCDVANSILLAVVGSGFPEGRQPISWQNF